MNEKKYRKISVLPRLYNYLLPHHRSLYLLFPIQINDNAK
jgi:hypothetical protein